MCHFQNELHVVITSCLVLLLDILCAGNNFFLTTHISLSFKSFEVKQILFFTDFFPDLHCKHFFILRSILKAFSLWNVQKPNKQT